MSPNSPRRIVSHYGKDITHDLRGVPFREEEPIKSGYANLGKVALSENEVVEIARLEYTGGAYRVKGKKTLGWLGTKFAAPRII